MKIEIHPIENGTMVEFKEHALAGSKIWSYDDWNEAISAAQHLLEEQRYTEDESVDTHETRRETE